MKARVGSLEIEGSTNEVLELVGLVIEKEKRKQHKIVTHAPIVPSVNVTKTSVPNHFKQWSRIEVLRVLDLLKKGYTLGAIAKELGRKKGAITNLICKIKKPQYRSPTLNKTLEGLTL